ncbi:MAG: YqeG family HAD IIIA-type phosphatase [Coriobacteriales bacterium]|jgi:HAD superfamily phosphatase (TIGR01668 family)|nr:YqeG family HAD IIIA-type phosphatase [Coriobacteriales bacterium]
MFSPNRFLKCVCQLSPSDLKAGGVRYILLDVDNTIVARGTNHIDALAKQWLEELRKEDIRICLLSNNWHKIVHSYAAELGLPIVYKAMKPLPFAFIKAKRKIGAKRKQTLVVGDQMITDVLGGNFLGMRTVLVLPLVKQDLWHTLLLRRLERTLLRGKTPENDLKRADRIAMDNLNKDKDANAV